MKITFLGDCRLDGRFCGAACETADLFADSDLVVINLETAVGDDLQGCAQKRHPLRASFAELERVARAFEGRLVVNLANNHSDDLGKGASARLRETLPRLGVRCVGGRGPLSVATTDQGNVGLFGFRFPARVCRLETMDGPAVVREVAEAVRAFEHAVALVHWGEEYVFFPSPRQRRLGRMFAACGFNLVVGAHPHVIQGVERVDGCCIAYSLGNGTFSVSSQQAGARAALALCWSPDAVPGGCDLVPLGVSIDGGVHRLGPRQHAQIEQAVRHDLVQRAPSGLAWYCEAAAPFFGNHLKSWWYRIRRFGVLEIARMLRMFCTRYYALMFLGAVGSAFRRCGSHGLGARMDAIAAVDAREGPSG